MSKLGVLSVAALLMTAGAAEAAIVGAVWRQVNNAASPYPPNSPPSADPIAGAMWTAGGPWRTYDLFLIGNTVGEGVNGVNAGGDGSSHHINVAGGTIFNHPSGGNDRTQSFEPFFSALPFDTFATFGGTATTAGQSAQFAGPVNLTGAGGELRFTSFTQPPAMMVASSNPAGAELWVLRVTIQGSATALGGGNSTIEVGLGGGVLQVVQVHNAIPAPGALALMGLAGLTAARRRR